MSKSDPGSNCNITEGLPALSRTTDTYYSDAIDHVNAESASFAVSCGAWATGFTATVQHCATDSATPGDWSDQTVDGSGNDVSVTFTEADFGTLNVPQPLNRFSRLKLVLGGTCVCGVTNISGPLLSIEPDATSQI